MISKLYKFQRLYNKLIHLKMLPKSYILGYKKLKRRINEGSLYPLFIDFVNEQTFMINQKLLIWSDNPEKLFSRLLQINNHSNYIDLRLSLLLRHFLQILTESRNKSRLSLNAKSRKVQDIKELPQIFLQVAPLSLTSITTVEFLQNTQNNLHKIGYKSL